MTLNIIAFGANLGTTTAANATLIRHAASRLGVVGTSLSPLYRTPAFPAGSGPDYVNAVGILHSKQPAEAILARLHAVEARFGRRRGARWAARVVDLDLLAAGSVIWPDRPTLRAWLEMAPADQRHAVPDRLVLPHPRLQDRAFVLVPLCDVAPNWRHPLTGRTARAMCAALPGRDRAAIRPLHGLSHHRLRLRA